MAAAVTRPAATAVHRVLRTTNSETHPGLPVRLNHPWIDYGRPKNVRRQKVGTAASAEPWNHRSEEASRTLSRCLDLVKNRQLDYLVDYLPNEAVQEAVVLSHPNSDAPEFQQVLESMLLEQPGSHFLDSYAIRHLVTSAPSRLEGLSALLVNPKKYIQRCASSTATGEECVLTFTVTAVEPDSVQFDATDLGSVSSSSSSCSSSATTWKLSSVQGEPMFPELPTAPSPEFTPESVVKAQIEALRDCDVARVYRLLAPSSQTLVGGLLRFAKSFSSKSPYSPLLRHAGVASVRRCQSSSSAYLEVVAVESPSGGRHLYCWILRRQDSGPMKDCWCTDFVKVVDDPKLRGLLATLPPKLADSLDT